MLRLKDDVRVYGIRPEILLALIMADQVYTSFGIRETWVTSVSEGQHKAGSFHYKGLAFDLRISNIPTAGLGAVHAKLKEVLGKDFDVLLEKDHIHVEYDPKEPY
jgi:hypothetical protein